MRLILVCLAAAVAASCLACSSIPAVSGATDSPFAGTWAQHEPVGGTSLTFTLTVDDTTVTGTGTYSLEGGRRSGTLTATGAINGDRLQLAMTYDDGNLAQFDGQVASERVLSGSLHFGSPLALTPSALVTFDRKD